MLHCACLHVVIELEISDLLPMVGAGAPGADALGLCLLGSGMSQGVMVVMSREEQ